MVGGASGRELSYEFGPFVIYSWLSDAKRKIQQAGRGNCAALQRVCFVRLAIISTRYHAGSLAHPPRSPQAGILTASERSEIENGLREIEKEIEAGKFQWDRSLEDVHMNIEAALTKRGSAPRAQTAHGAEPERSGCARSASLREGGDRASVGRPLTLQRVLLMLAEQHVDLVMPGYTHLQRAQPIFFAHYLLAQLEAFQRDADRLSDCLKRTDVLPLGSGALAGSTIVLDRELIARELGFARVSQNSLDAVSDRDFVCEFLFGSP